MSFLMIINCLCIDMIKYRDLNNNNLYHKKHLWFFLNHFNQIALMHSNFCFTFADLIHLVSKDFIMLNPCSEIM